MEDTMQAWATTHFGAAALGDARLTARLVAVGKQLASHPNESFPSKFHDPAAQAVQEHESLDFYCAIPKIKVTT